jgi:hypothetical protein
VGTTGPILGAGSGSGSGKIGAGSTGAVSACTKWMGVTEAGSTSAGSVSAVLARVTAGPTLPFGGVMMGLGCVRMGCEGMVGRKSLALGMGPIDVSKSVAQSIRCGSCAVALCVV